MTPENETGYYPLPRWMVDRCIDNMQNRGWSNEKILERCSYKANSFWEQKLAIPLINIVHTNHPIAQEWGLNEIRRGLYTSALNEITIKKNDIFLHLFRTDNLYLQWDEGKKREIKNLEEYARRLTEVYSPTCEIRNR